MVDEKPIKAMIELPVPLHRNLVAYTSRRSPGFLISRFNVENQPALAHYAVGQRPAQA
ncbi:MULTISPECIES: hypothetical protein [unclassified Phyllobacterium]|uniref:hypothetical protein n=1 Tax=unclassified Phyllobacterium TaxID=2638441 RepID=UPI003F829402